MNGIVYQCVARMQEHPEDKVFCLIIDPDLRHLLAQHMRNEHAKKHLTSNAEECDYFFLAGPLMHENGPDCISLPVKSGEFSEIRNLVLAMNHTLAAHDHSASVWFTISAKPELMEYMQRISKIKELRFTDDDDEVETIH
jgi:hypothetical protein